MQPSTAKMLEAISAFHPQPGDDAVGDLYELTDGFNRLTDQLQLVPAMFALIERADSVDLGAPGPLVDCIESTGHERYYPQLVESLRTRPQFATLTMAKRILNARRLGVSNAPDDQEWRQVMDAVRQVSSNVAASAGLRQLASECVALNSPPAAG